MNISRYSHHFPCQSQHVLIRKYVSSKWPCSNRTSYILNKQIQAANTPGTISHPLHFQKTPSRKLPLHFCSHHRHTESFCYFLWASFTRCQMGVNIQHSRFEVVKGFMDSFTDLGAAWRMEQQQKHIEPKSRIIILLQKDTVRAFSGLLYSYLSYIAFPQEQCHIASQSNVLEVALFYWTIIVIVGRQILGAYCPRNTGYLPWYSLILFQQILA